MQHNMSDTARCMFLNQPPLSLRERSIKPDKGKEEVECQRVGGGAKTRVISSKSTIGNSVYVLAVM